MVFSYLCSLVSYYYGYSDSDRMNNVPFKMSGLNEESLQEAIKNLKPVTNEFTIKLRAEIAENESRIDHIRTEEETKNNKPIDEFELSKAKNCKIQVLDCTSMDLRGYISNLKKTHDIPSYQQFDNQLPQEHEGEEGGKPQEGGEHEGKPQQEDEIIPRKYETVFDEIHALGEMGMQTWFQQRKK